ncbi:MAG: 2-phospho-L-lactate transferase [Burkholderiales bacterium]|nr:2-phospho-L-lactate transferase [Burkholderiales bacterium]
MTLVALSGGVGGAKLVSGLAGVCGPGELMAVVNTGDDFDYLGLRVCPDIDSVLYAAAGLNDSVRGWGRENESWNFHHSLPQLGFESWFMLGDRDLATHVLRTDWLRQGATLSEVTARMAHALGLAFDIVPMSDDAVRTHVDTPEGVLAFQDYFVRRRCEPLCRGIRFEGAGTARLAAPLARQADAGAVQGWVICPSNPFVSIGPMLAVPGLRDRLGQRRAPCVAVSPIIAGQAVKGPAAKMMAELGLEVSALGVARRYAGLIDGLVLDRRDAAQAPAIEALGIRVGVTDTLMTDADSRERVARASLELIARCG